MIYVHAAPDAGFKACCMKSGAYPIFPSLHDVPRGVFKNKRLVVEKFLPERDGSAYCLRYCYFFGDRAVNMLMRSNDRVVKGVRAFSCDLTPAPPEMESMVTAMRAGATDFVVKPVGAERRPRHPYAGAAAPSYPVDDEV